jgi:hypothetical protein
MLIHLKKTFVVLGVVVIIIIIRSSGGIESFSNVYKLVDNLV